MSNPPPGGWGGPPPGGPPPGVPGGPAGVPAGGWGGPPPGGWGGPPPGVPGGPQAGYYFAPPQPQASRGSSAAIVAAFLGILLLIAFAVGIIVLLSSPPPPVAPCDPGVPCAPQPSLRPVADATPKASSPVLAPTPTPALGVPTGPAGSPPATPLVPAPTPTSDSPPVVSGAVWGSEPLALSFEYNSDHFSIGTTTGDLAVLNGIIFDAQIRIRTVPASVSPAELIESELAVVDRFVLGRALDTDEYDALLGPSIGYLGGDGAVYSGTLVGSDGTPIEPVGVTILASSDGRMTVAITVIAGQPDLRLGSDTHQHAVRQSADHILKSFDWDTTK